MLGRASPRKQKQTRRRRRSPDPFRRAPEALREGARLCGRALPSATPPGHGETTASTTPLDRILHTFLLGIRSLFAHRLRSFLTALGIVLGVASVIVMLAVGEAARYEAVRQLEDLGATTVIVRSVKPNEEKERNSGADI